MKEIKKIIHQNYTNPAFNINALTRKMGISYSVLYEKFIREINITPKRYIENKRLEHAISLIKENNTKVCETCYLSGYENTKTFRAVVKRRLELNATQLKEKIQSLNEEAVHDIIAKEIWDHSQENNR
jgi:methylphosphotriester-DNA--protein-cysteine methyltransferase